MATPTTQRLQALLSLIQRQHSAEWRLPEPKPLAEAIEGKAALTELVRTETIRLNARRITFAQWQDAILATLADNGINPLLLVGLLLGVRRITSQPDITQLEQRFTQRVVALTEALKAERITVDAWRKAFAAELLLYHPAAAIAGGGRSDAALELGRQRAQQQVAFLDAWANEIAGGKPVQVSRATLYAGAGAATATQSLTRSRGMPDLPAYPRDWSTDCRSNCYCRWRFETLADGDWDCYWVYRPEKDNCKQCPKRAREWGPLRIRGGVIQPYDSAGLFAPTLATLAKDIGELIS